MIAICTHGCQITGLGIFREGETVELDDGYLNDPMFMENFVPDPKSIHDRNAKKPDQDKKLEKAREAIVSDMLNLVNRRILIAQLKDDGYYVNPVLLDESSAQAYMNGEFVMLDDQKRAEMLADLHLEHYGYDLKYVPQGAKPNKKGGKADLEERAQELPGMGGKGK